MKKPHKINPTFFGKNHIFCDIRIFENIEKFWNGLAFLIFFQIMEMYATYRPITESLHLDYSMILPSRYYPTDDLSIEGALFYDEE